MIFPIHLFTLKLFRLLKMLPLFHPSNHVCCPFLPAGRLHAPVGSLRLFQRSEDQISADPHLAHALDG